MSTGGGRPPGGQGRADMAQASGVPEPEYDPNDTEAARAQAQSTYHPSTNQMMGDLRSGSVPGGEVTDQAGPAYGFAGNPSLGGAASAFSATDALGIGQTAHGMLPQAGKIAGQQQLRGALRDAPNAQADPGNSASYMGNYTDPSSPARAGAMGQAGANDPGPPLYGNNAPTQQVPLSQAVPAAEDPSRSSASRTGSFPNMSGQGGVSSRGRKGGKGSSKRS